MIIRMMHYMTQSLMRDRDRESVSRACYGLVEMWCDENNLSRSLTCMTLRTLAS